MKAMILAAGEGTRLQPLTDILPKPLVPIVNRPVMEHILLWLRKHGVTEIIINTFFKAEQIERYFGDGSKLNVSIRYSREDKLWGTAGGVKRVEKLFDDTFLVIGGDDLSDVNLTSLFDFHRQRKAVATIGLKKVENPEQYGVVITNDSGKIERFQEKPKRDAALSLMANTGIYIFEPKIFDHIPPGEFYDFGKQVFPGLLEKKADFFGAPVDGYWCDIGSMAEYKEAHWAILEKRCQAMMEYAENQPGIWIGNNCEIHPSAVLTAPCVIGDDCKIEDGAKLSGHVILGNNVHVGKNAELNRIIVWSGAQMTAKQTFEDSVITAILR